MENIRKIAQREKVESIKFGSANLARDILSPNDNLVRALENIPNDKNLTKGDLILDDLKQLCFWKNTVIELTVAEFNLIKSLAKHPGVIKDRNQLMDAMYGDTIYVDDRTIDSHIKRLRKKFKLYDSTFDQIRTRYGSGYSWRE